MRLRELIEEKTGIPTHQQRLMLETTVLQDWDDEGKIIHLYNYPAIHDGAILSLVQLTTGRKFRTFQYQPSICSQQNLLYQSQFHDDLPQQYGYVNIPNPEVRQLFGVHRFSIAVH